MSLINEIKSLGKPTLALGKDDEWLEQFAFATNSYSMHTKWSIGEMFFAVSQPNSFYMEFENIKRIDGCFLFCINGVDLKVALNGFKSYEEADGRDNITEWELSIIINNEEYLNRTIFHNNKVKFYFNKTKSKFQWKK